LAFTKDFQQFNAKGNPIDTGKYSNPDNDPRGDWASIDLSVQATKDQRPNQYYEIVDPETGNVYPANPNRVWSKSKTVVDKMIKEGRILFPSNGKGRPREKKFLSDLKSGTTGYSSWLDSSVVGYTTNGTKELSELFENRIFDFPKPISLLKEFYHQATKEDDIVLDFFAGSGTTAHAVMDLNKEGGGNRKFILVQIPEATDEKSEAYKAGYKTISDICIERVKRAGKKLIDEGNKVDAGFKVFKLATSHFPENTFAPDPDKTDEENKKALEAYIKKATSQKGLFKDGVKDLVYEIALKDGFELTLTMDKVKDFDKNTVYKVSDNHKEALICVDDNLNQTTIDQLESHKDQRFICLHTSVNTTKKWNLQNILGSNLWLV
jgi:adenine-specific DNA-methyltransferase